MAAPKFPLARVRELHKHLSEILAQCDGQSDPAKDNSDAGTSWAGDRKTVKSMDEAFPQMGRLSK